MALLDEVVLVVVIVFLDLITDEDNLDAIRMISACDDNHALFSIEKLDLITMFALLGAWLSSNSTASHAETKTSLPK